MQSDCVHFCLILHEEIRIYTGWPVLVNETKLFFLSNKELILTYLEMFIYISTHVKVKGQLAGVSSLFKMWVPKFKLRL